MKRLFLFLILTLALGIGAQAQIPADVTAVMDKCRQAMDNSAGMEYTSAVKVAVGPVTLMKMDFVIGNKGNLERATMKTKIMGQEIIYESGFDGKESWEVKHSSDGDTITIGNTKKKGSNDGEVDLDLDKMYRKAKMKNKGDYYEITFSDPVDKGNEAKKMTVKISSKTYRLQELKPSAHGGKMTMTFSKYRIGLKDDYFRAPRAKYPGAVVVKK